LEEQVMMGSLNYVETLVQNTGLHWTTLLLSAALLYMAGNCIYNLYFHPASRFPGPRLAAISNVWYAYHWITGKYPIAIANALKQYGDVVRIAPNEVVFITPQAAADIYNPQSKGLELFPKADFISLGWADQGVTWETDPVKHRHKAKRLVPAFSAKSLKSKEPTIHKYTDFFVQKMTESGSRPEGVELRQWADWLAMDMAADLGYGRQMHQLRDGKIIMMGA
jgi:cytochrome P450